MSREKGLTKKQRDAINKTLETLANFGKDGDIILTACNLGGKPLIGIHKKRVTKNV